MISYEFPSGRNVDGPTQVFARINADAQFSAQRTLLSRSGSNVTFGDFLVMPFGQGILYVQPVYVQANQNAIPELKLVVVVNGGEIGLGTTLEQAISEAVSGEVTPPDNGGEPPVGTVSEQVTELLQQASRHFAAADQALRQGDLATYQSEIAAAQDAVQQAGTLLDSASGATGASGASGATGAPLLTGAKGLTGATGSTG
jgi:uncharacterized protein